MYQDIKFENQIIRSAWLSLKKNNKGKSMSVWLKKGESSETGYDLLHSRKRYAEVKRTSGEITWKNKFILPLMQKIEVSRDYQTYFSWPWENPGKIYWVLSVRFQPGIVNFSALHCKKAFNAEPSNWKKCRDSRYEFTWKVLAQTIPEPKI